MLSNGEKDREKNGLWCLSNAIGGDAQPRLHYTSRGKATLLDDGIGDTLVSVDVTITRYREINTRPVG